jgi:hypothetical protein
MVDPNQDRSLHHIMYKSCRNSSNLPKEMPCGVCISSHASQHDCKHAEPGTCANDATQASQLTAQLRMATSTDPGVLRPNYSLPCDLLSTCSGDALAPPPTAPPSCRCCSRSSPLPAKTAAACWAAAGSRGNQSIACTA